MFCRKCGTQVEKDKKFCHACGVKTADVNKESLYSREWVLKGFRLASPQYVDILVEDGFVTFIKLPKYYLSVWGFFLGLIVGKLIGACVGSIIGAHYDGKKRANLRSLWVDQDSNVISMGYEPRVFKKLSIEALKNNIEYKKNSVAFSEGGEKIVFKRPVRSFRSPERTEINRLFPYLQERVS